MPTGNIGGISIPDMQELLKDILGGYRGDWIASGQRAHRHSKGKRRR